jgi:hypothetical protein
MAENGRSDALVELLASGNLVEIESTDECGNTALHLAARNGHLNACRALVQHGAKARRVNVAGQSPEELARSAGHASIGDYLHAVARASAPSNTPRSTSIPLTTAASLLAGGCPERPSARGKAERTPRRPLQPVSANTLPAGGAAPARASHESAVGLKNLLSSKPRDITCAQSSAPSWGGAVQLFPE